MAYQLQQVPASEQRREGSTWQGGRHPPCPEASVAQASADLVLNARLGRLAGHVSPAALATAWQDRVSHLLLSPDRQIERALLAIANLQRWLRSARYLVDGRPVSLTDHVAPWRSVDKILPLTDTEVTFLLTSGGRNAGVVSPPGTPVRSYQMATHSFDTPYVDPESRQRDAPQRESSWWPAWEAWLARRAGPLVPAAPASGLAEAPGSDVLAP